METHSILRGKHILSDRRHLTPRPVLVHGALPGAQPQKAARPLPVLSWVRRHSISEVLLGP